MMVPVFGAVRIVEQAGKLCLESRRHRPLAKLKIGAAASENA
jgi:hypothetical protein